MSSILDALERASKERAARQGQKINSDVIGRQSAADRQSAVEKQLRTENDKQKRMVIMLAIVFGVMLIGAVATMGYMMFVKGDRDARDRDMARQSAEKAAEPKTALQEIMPVLKSGLEIPTTPVANAVQPAPTAVPTATTTPSPTTAPSPTNPPTPSPAPTEETLRNMYIQNAPEATNFKSYKGVFTDGQIIRPAEIEWQIGGVMELKSGNIAIINDKQVREGQKLGDLQVMEIRSGLITADVGDGTIIKIRF